MPRYSRVLLAFCILPAGAVSLAAADKPTIDFNRDVRPILADKCYACHGPDAKEVQAGLRLDLPESATAASESGSIAIVPGKPEDSELVRRIDSDDELERMPPPEAHKDISAEERAVLRKWIAEGAEYKRHWSFLAPERSAEPEVNDAAWVRNPIDRFVLARLEAEGMKPNAEASRETLIRRVSLDLRGLPPTVAEVDAFLSDAAPGAYERMVDRMLASPHYGEKLTRIWMDLARYGDTNGYHYDSTRQVWLWRDWVINAYNSNMPFDQFTIEQLAGDLLPEATAQQRIASGFNRNTRYNEEGGADPQEWLVRYAVDRTSTLGQVWLGLTLNCAECHSHKYDPISQREFYSLYAFFNSLNEPGAQGHNGTYPPLLKVASAKQEKTIADSKAAIARLEKQIAETLAKIEYSEPVESGESTEPAAVETVWIDDDTPPGASLQGNGGDATWNWVTAPEHPVHTGKRSMRRSGAGLHQHYFLNASEPLEITADAKLFAYVWLDPKDPPKTVQLQFNDGIWEHRAFWGERRGYGGGNEAPSNHHVGDLPAPGQWARLEVFASAVGLKPGAKLVGWAFTQFDGTAYFDTAGRVQREADDRARHSLAHWQTQAAGDKSLPDPVRKALAAAPEKRSEEQTLAIRNHYLQHVHAESRALFESLERELAESRRLIEETEKAIPFQLVSEELAKPRDAFVLLRGDFTKPGEKVERAVPAAMPPLAEEAPRNRLGLAQWLVSPEHPLTARVTVNRYWAQLFGRGIVETMGDFGTIGRYPSHPELLDWLAVEFRESGWDTKHMFRLMVTSAAYRQSSVNDHRYDTQDPRNKLLWRAPRFRLPAEEIRDAALQVSGLLAPEIGGPSVFPFQPEKYYDGKKGGWSWNVSQEDDRYRRGMYTFWRRTTPYPTFIIFDAPDRSECTVSREQTNTPLQALAALNDPQFVEAARVFGQRVLSEGPADTEGRLTFAFRCATARTPNERELAVLQESLAAQLAHYGENPEAAKKLVNVGAAEKPQDMDLVEHAAWTALGNLLLTLDETITRE